MDSILDWLAQKFDQLFLFFKDVFQSFMDFIKDIFLDIFELFLDGVHSVIASLDVPTFATDGMGPLLSNIDPTLTYFLSQSGISNAFAVLAAGFAFRMTRKLVTLGQW